jgi:hypothetical protein
MDNNRKFRFKLASHLGMTVNELEERMTHKELLEWQEYALEEPLMSDRTEMMLAQVISSLSSIPAFEAMITLSDKDKATERQKALIAKIKATG